MSYIYYDHPICDDPHRPLSLYILSIRILLTIIIQFPLASSSASRTSILSSSVYSTYLSFIFLLL
ncbi:hypothetical protein BCR43DRAFT_486096 [Syncephalastrum racemosum]|uniref:Uncharacterized protein n=1 Tax=Syncephalastrum racemosum TaxID=13706 RepID=A0A1X2HNP4_SYNRA|nr:hypothetical protein BCR43DRAFT_486096 [Syncephalastrum racemosum]